MYAVYSYGFNIISSSNSVHLKVCKGKRNSKIKPFNQLTNIHETVDGCRLFYWLSSKSTILCPQMVVFVTKKPHLLLYFICFSTIRTVRA